MVESPKPEKLWTHSFFLAGLCLAALVLAAAAVGGGYLVWFRHIHETPPPPDVSHIRPLLKNGDVILRSGVGLWSEQIRSYNTRDKRFSHVGIVSIEPDGACMVIHAEANDLTGSGEVFRDTLEHFVGESKEVGISRLHVAAPDALAEAAKSFVGVPFDWKFDTGDDSSIYCTELVDLSLRKIDPGFRLPESNGVIPTEACLMPEYFTEIPVGN